MSCPSLRYLLLAPILVILLQYYFHLTGTESVRFVDQVALNFKTRLVPFAAAEASAPASEYVPAGLE